MSGPIQPFEFPQKDKEFVLFLYRYFIRIKWVVEKICYRRQDFDAGDDEVLIYLYSKFSEARKRREN